MLDTVITYHCEAGSLVAEVIQREVFARSKVKWKTNEEIAKYNLAIKLDDSLDHDEAYQITRPSESCFTICGRTRRALLYGAGKFLRCLDIGFKQDYAVPYCPWIRMRDNIIFPLCSRPRYAWRGHQIAYRPKTHSYDATTPEQMKQEILEHVLFGINTIEMIPPKLDDCQQSPHFKDSWTERLGAMSAWCDKLGIRVSLWYPAFPGADWQETFRAMHRLDVLFVPGGDPGGRHPVDLFRIVREHAAVARRYFPDVEVWVSSQFGLSVSVDLQLSAWSPKERLQEFYKQVELNKDLLTGIVYGPWTAATSRQFRQHIPADLPIRHYPDLCHNLKSQYIVGPHWDPAFAMTYHRESINPRPTYFAAVFDHEMPWCCHGAGCYSEGCGDDVNKHVWSGLLWGQDDVRTILNDYALWYIGDARAADVIFALERNWQVPLKSGKVLQTLQEVIELRSQLTCRTEQNWRWQMIYFRAVCDAFLHQYQYGDRRNMDLAWPVRGLSAVPWQTDVKHESQRYFTPSAMALYGALQASAAMLHALAGLQLDVCRYGSMHVERGGHLDLLRHLSRDDGISKGNFQVLRLCEVPTTGYEGPILDYADTSHPAVADSIRSLPTRWLSFYTCIWPSALPMEVIVDIPQGTVALEIVYVGRDLLLEGGDYEELGRIGLPVRCICNGTLLHDYKTPDAVTAPYKFPIQVESDNRLHLIWDVEDRSKVTVRSVPLPIADIKPLSSI